MGDKKGLILCFFIFLFSLSGVFAWADNTSLYQEVDGCNLLNTTGATYVLTGNVTSTATCFNITQQNITLDCNGNWITYSTGGAANTYGVYTNQFNTTIHNCNVLDGNWGSSQTTRYGIYFNSANNSIIFNAFVNTSKSNAVYLYNGAKYNNLSSITATSNTNHGIYLWSGSNFNTLSNINATSNTGYGIYIYSNSNNTLSNINAISNTSYGIYLYSNSNNTFSNINAISNTGYGMYISTSSNNNLSNISIISTNGEDDLYFVDVPSISYCKNTFNNVTDKNGKPIIYLNEIPSNIDNIDGSMLIMCNVNSSNITSSNFTRGGIYIFYSNNNLLSNINATSNKRYGITLSSSSNNTLSNLNATSNTNYGIYASKISNNVLNNVSASSNTNYGIYIYSISPGLNNTLNNVSVISINLEEDLYLSDEDFISSCNNNFTNFNGKDGKPIIQLTGNYLNVSDIDGSKLILCNVNFSNITNSNFTRGGIRAYYSNNNLLSKVYTICKEKSSIFFNYGSNNTLFNINTTSNTNYGIWLKYSSSNTLSNLNATSNTNYGIYLLGAENNTLFDFTATSTGSYGIMINSGSNNTLFDFNATSNTGNAINLDYGSSSSTLSNFTATSNTGNGIYFYYSSNNTFSNFTTASNTNYGIWIRNSPNNIFSNFTVTSNTNHGIYLSGDNNTFSNLNATSLGNGYGIVLSGSNNTFSNLNATSKTNYGIYLYSNSNSMFSNITATSNISTALYLDSNSDSNLIINSTLISLNKNGTLLYLTSNCNGNRFYWNNFTNTSGYYAQDLNGANYYNTTLNGKGEGNIWYNIINGSVNISGNVNSSVYPSLYIGKHGTGYPYNSTNSFGKISGNVVDYAPLTNQFYTDTTPPYFITIPNNASLFYGNESLGVDFNANDENYFEYFSINDTRFSINQTGFLSNETSLAVGNYEINVTINDTTNNINWTIYTIQVKKSNYYDCGIYFNVNSPIIYPDNFIAYTNCSSGYNLYLNGTSISNATAINSVIGYYNFTVQRTDTENYTHITDTQFFTVNQNTEECQVFFNATSPLQYPAIFLVWANCSSDFTLYRNGTIISNNSEQALSPGAYNFSLSRTDNSNYTNNYNETQFIILPDLTSPTYSSVSHNSTYANNITLFSININDETALETNGQYIFSTNNSGEWVNDTAVNFTSTPSWANVTKTLNSTVGTVVGYMWYFNDSEGNMNSTSVYSLTTTQAPVVDPPSSGGGGSTAQVQTQYQLGREFSEQGESLKLRKNYQVGFRHQEESHTLTLNSFTTNTARVTIQSDPISATLEKDVAQSFNIDDEEGTDVEITYQGTSGSEAQFFIKKIIEVTGESEVFANAEGGEVQETETNQISTNELFGTSGSGSESVDVAKEKTKRAKNPFRTVLISLIIMGIIIAGLYAIGKNEKKKKDHYLGFFDN